MPSEVKPSRNAAKVTCELLLAYLVKSAGGPWENELLSHTEVAYMQLPKLSVIWISMQNAFPDLQWHNFQGTRRIEAKNRVFDCSLPYVKDLLGLWYGPNGWALGGPTLYSPHKSSLKELYTSAQMNCPFCTHTVCGPGFRAIFTITLSRQASPTSCHASKLDLFQVWCIDGQWELTSLLFSRPILHYE